MLRLAAGPLAHGNPLRSLGRNLEEIKRRYLDLANIVQRLYKAVLPDQVAQEFDAQVTPVQVIASKVRSTS